MKRQEKFPETETFRYYNANPKNRIAADCVVRAISTALGQTWEQTVRELTELGIKMGRVLNEKATYTKYLANKGWIKHPMPRKSDGSKYTGAEFARWLSNEDPYAEDYGNVICSVAHHLYCIMPTFATDGYGSYYKVHDIWNSTKMCVGNYWTFG